MLKSRLRRLLRGSPKAAVNPDANPEAKPETKLELKRVAQEALAKAGKGGEGKPENGQNHDSNPEAQLEASRIRLASVVTLAWNESKWLRGVTYVAKTVEATFKENYYSLCESTYKDADDPESPR